MIIEFKSAPISPRAPSADRLTPREREIVGLAHLSNADIALALGCAPATVKAHWEHIRAKLGASNRTEAALLLVERRAA